jgi:oligogalacturonide lyase
MRRIKHSMFFLLDLLLFLSMSTFGQSSQPTFTFNDLQFGTIGDRKTLDTAVTKVSAAFGDSELARDWIDPYTGHRIKRISRVDGTTSLYFNLNPYTVDGKKILVNSPEGLQSIDLETDSVETLIPGHVNLIQTGRKTGDAYYIRGKAIYAFNVDTKQEHKVIDLPEGVRRIEAINCDETLLAGAMMGIDPTGKVVKPKTRVVLPQWQRMFPTKKHSELTQDEIIASGKEDRLSRWLANPQSMCLFTINVKTGELRKFGYAYANLNHLQFSPTDPKLLLFAHEGTWHETKRPWTINVDEGEPRLMHKRKMDMEIAGHEFFGPDGNIWYDLQTPRSQMFWIAGVNIKTGERIRYQVDRNYWSVHYNVSHDGKMFSGDGGDPAQVAFAPDGMWMNLFRVQQDQTLSEERLVNMINQDYRTGDGEPNGSFTPDDKWIVFRANFLGSKHVFKVEVAKATDAERTEVMAKATPADMAMMKKKPRRIPATVAEAAQEAKDTVIPPGPSHAAEDQDDGATPPVYMPEHKSGVK